MPALVLSISYGKGCYRHVKINEGSTLYDLHNLIINIFDFTDDHLHVFFMNNRAWDKSYAYYSEYFEETENFTNEHKLSEFGLEKGSKFLYIFDFGDEHRFNIKVLRREDEDIDEPQVIRSCGESPEQYPQYEDNFPIFNTSILTKNEQKRADLLNDYANAAVNLYGVISFDEFIELFNRQNEKKTDADEMFETLLRYVYTDSDYCFYQDYLVDVNFEEEDFKGVNELLSLRNGKPKYIPPKETFLKYSDMDYDENAAGYAAIRKLLERSFGSTPDVLELYLCIYYNRRIGISFHEFSQLLDEFDMKFRSKDDLSEFLKLFTDVSNNTRIWINNGFTPYELSKKASARQVKSKKIGRNEPCPCGSGKKYKHCCGR